MKGGLSVQSLRRWSICAGWLIWAAAIAAQLLLLARGQRAGDWLMLLWALGFAPYLLTLHVLEPWLRKRGRVWEENE